MPCPPLRPEGLTKEEQRSLLTLVRLRTASPTGRPGQTLLLTPTRISDRGCAKPLLTALLQLERSEPTRTNQPGMPAR